MADPDPDAAEAAAQNDLITTAEAWLAAEPDADISDELAALIDAAERGEADELAARFDGRLQFGTAGLRAAVAAGSMRMNRLVVRQAAAGLGRWLLDAEASGDIADAAKRGVVVAHDARRKSDLFADDTARVLAAMGIRTMLHPGCPADAGAGLVDHRHRCRRWCGGHRLAQPAGRQRLQGVSRDRIADRVADRHRHRRPDRPVRPADGRARPSR